VGSLSPSSRGDSQAASLSQQRPVLAGRGLAEASGGFADEGVGLLLKGAVQIYDQAQALQGRPRAKGGTGRLGVCVVNLNRLPVLLRLLFRHGRRRGLTLTHTAPICAGKYIASPTSRFQMQRAAASYRKRNYVHAKRGSNYAVFGAIDSFLGS